MRFTSSAPQPATILPPARSPQMFHRPSGSTSHCRPVSCARRRCISHPRHLPAPESYLRRKWDPPSLLRSTSRRIMPFSQLRLPPTKTTPAATAPAAIAPGVVGPPAHNIGRSQRSIKISTTQPRILG
eukprot:Pompholyxophrys_punicea_v1_NODE_3_length_10569_cov_612.508655.p6 type:complete len:128 gc:universal NODE_3_length_10569_cov_612.508655:5748-5365(-)